MEVGKLVLLIALQSSNNSNYIEKFSELDDSDWDRLTEVLREYMDDDNESEISEGGFTSWKHSLVFNSTQDFYESQTLKDKIELLEKDI